MKNYLSIDIGGTYIKYGLIDKAESKLYHTKKVKTPHNTNQAIIKQVKEIIHQMQNESQLSGICMSTAGIVERHSGKIIYAGPTIHNYIGTDFKEALKSFNLPISVVNDVDAALLGEIMAEDVSQFDNIFCITLGTGIGGAWFYKNKLIDGSHFQANSVGYLLYDPKSNSNFEMRASTSALIKLIENEWPQDISTQALFEKARQNNAQAKALLSDWTDEIAKGLAQIILIADPELLIIGGGVSAQGDFLREMIESQITKYLPHNFYKTIITTAKKQNNAALYGAFSAHINQI